MWCIREFPLIDELFRTANFVIWIKGHIRVNQNYSFSYWTKTINALFGFRLINTNNSMCATAELHYIVQSIVQCNKSKYFSIDHYNKMTKCMRLAIVMASNKIHISCSYCGLLFPNFVYIKHQQWVPKVWIFGFVLYTLCRNIIILDIICAVAVAMLFAVFFLSSCLLKMDSLLSFFEQFWFCRLAEFFLISLSRFV